MNLVSRLSLDYIFLYGVTSYKYLLCECFRRPPVIGWGSWPKTLTHHLPWSLVNRIYVAVDTLYFKGLRCKQWDSEGLTHYPTTYIGRLGGA